jgi:hypothetical protein
MEFGLALLETSLFLPRFVLCVQPLRLVSTSSRSLPLVEAITTVRSESRCALRLQYVDLVVSTEVAVAVCCCFTVFSC